MRRRPFLFALAAVVAVGSALPLIHFAQLTGGTCPNDPCLLTGIELFESDPCCKTPGGAFTLEDGKGWDALAAFGQAAGAIAAAAAAIFAYLAVRATRDSVRAQADAVRAQTADAAVRALAERYAAPDMYASLQRFGRFMGDVVNQPREEGALLNAARAGRPPDSPHSAAPERTFRGLLRHGLGVRGAQLVWTNGTRMSGAHVRKRLMRIANAAAAAAARGRNEEAISDEEGLSLEEASAAFLLAAMLRLLDTPNGASDRVQEWGAAVAREIAARAGAPTLQLSAADRKRLRLEWAREVIAARRHIHHHFKLVWSLHRAGALPPDRLWLATTANAGYALWLEAVLPLTVAIPYASRTSPVRDGQNMWDDEWPWELIDLVMRHPGPAPRHD